MIAWWGWLLIWAGLVLLLLAALALLAWRLFRKGIRVFSDLADASIALERDDADPPARPQLAVLATSRDIRERESARLAHRAHRRELRSSARLARAKRIIRVDASAHQWPAGWYSSSTRPVAGIMALVSRRRRRM